MTMQILLTNDDGVYAEGLWALYRALSPTHDVTVVAPDRERSAIGHAITLYRPLRADKVQVNGRGSGWAVSGTPADCVKLALAELLDSPPDMVISGINPGANVGINIHYSGTVAAAKEATLYGIAALAVSIERLSDQAFETAARFVADLAPRVKEKGLPTGTFLNINLPVGASTSPAGVRLSHQGLEMFGEQYDRRHDPRNRPYYWPAAAPAPRFDDQTTDGAVLGDNYISITPIKTDMTDYQVLRDLRNWGVEKDI